MKILFDPSFDGSHISLVLVLGNDWLVPCKPIPVNDGSHLLKPLPSIIECLVTPHSWHPTKCVFVDLILSLSLTVYTASIRLAESLHDDTEAREALASLVKGCCSDDLFCSETVADHCLPTSDREPRNVILCHSKMESTTSPSTSRCLFTLSAARFASSQSLLLSLMTSASPPRTPIFVGMFSSEWLVMTCVGMVKVGFRPMVNRFVWSDYYKANALIMSSDMLRLWHWL